MTDRRDDSVCPHCHRQEMSHGVCGACGQYCGCSFDPTSMNDYCSHHRPTFTPPLPNARAGRGR
jgi:hypothetical protein